MTVRLWHLTRGQAPGPVPHNRHPPRPNLVTPDTVSGERGMTRALFLRLDGGKGASSLVRPGGSRTAQPPD